MLSTTKYASLCVLGIEVFYVLCLVYELFLPEKGRELHRAFEPLPVCLGKYLSMVWVPFSWQPRRGSRVSISRGCINASFRVKREIRVSSKEKKEVLMK
jgi:hypothetical protein